MENWLVMGGAILLVACFYPPFLGLVMGAGAVIVATIVVGKIIGA